MAENVRQADEENTSKPDRSGKENGSKEGGSDAKEQGADKSEDKPGDSQKPRGSVFRRHPIAMIVLLVVIVVGAILGVAYWLYSRHYETTDDAFIEAHVVAVSPKISGIVKAVYIDDNYHVKKGDLLLEFDDRDYQAALVQAEGNYAAAKGKLGETQAEISVASANVGQAQAELIVAQANAHNALDDLNRYLALDVRARSKQQMDNATAAERTTAAQVEDAKAKVAAAMAQFDDAQVTVKSAEGDLKAADGALQQARNNVGYCKIYAPADGVITRKDVEPGDYIQIDQPMFSIVEYDVWIVANFKETQLALMRAGQHVEADVDAYPGRKLTGTVQSIQNGTGSRFTLLPPENATGNYVKIVQRVPVKIVLDPHQNDDMDHLLSPGMSVDPSVTVR
jgi:membrane fusion protein, multidrug efflux system